MKYGNKKIQTADGVFDSKREFKRWCELKLLEKAGMITSLQRQVPFELIPSQRDKKTGKVVEHPVKYIADFVYTLDGEIVVEDTKGVRTADYIIKRKLMLKEHGIRIQEV